MQACLTTSMAFPDWLKTKRYEAGYTQAELARRIEKTRAYVAVLESGLNPSTGKPINPSAELIQDIVRALRAKGLDVTTSEAYKEAGITEVKDLPESSPDPTGDVAKDLLNRMVNEWLDKQGMTISQNQPSERLEGDTPLINSGDMLAKGGISPGETSAAIPINSGERGEGLDDAPQEGLIAFNVTTDLLPPLKPGLRYPVIRWDGETLISGDILLVKNGEGYEAKRYTQDADAEGLDKETTFVVIGRAY